MHAYILLSTDIIVAYHAQQTLPLPDDGRSGRHVGRLRRERLRRGGVAGAGAALGGVGAHRLAQRVLDHPDRQTVDVLRRDVKEARAGRLQRLLDVLQAEAHLQQVRGDRWRRR